MAVDWPTKKLEELRTILDNCQKQGKLQTEFCQEAMAELGRRSDGGMSFDRTLNIIVRAAKQRRYLSYGEIGEEYGLVGAKMKTAVPKHLEALNAYALQRGWPLLSAVVVTKEHLQDGKMDEATLTGFCKSAEKLGLRVDDPALFLKRHQEAVFTFAQKGVEP